MVVVYCRIWSHPAIPNREISGFMEGVKIVI